MEGFFKKISRIKILKQGLATERFKLSWPWVLLIASFGALWRLGQYHDYLPMGSPLGAMALFGGACFARRLQGYAFVLFAFFFSDMLLAYTVYAEYRTGFLYSGWWWTYGAFALMVPVGSWLLRRISLLRIGLGGVGVAFVHWLISDIGVCFSGTGSTAFGVPYGPGLAGVLKCYAAAIPWSARLMYSTWIYGLPLFGVYAWARHQLPQWRAYGWLKNTP